jgi:hypothetical protein
MTESKEARNKALVLKAFDRLFNKRDCAAAEGIHGDTRPKPRGDHVMLSHRPHRGLTQHRAFCLHRFAACDVRSGSVKRVGGAIGESAAVVAEIHQYLAALQSTQERSTS